MARSQPTDLGIAWNQILWILNFMPGNSEQILEHLDQASESYDFLKLALMHRRSRKMVFTQRSISGATQLRILWICPWKALEETKRMAYGSYFSKIIWHVKSPERRKLSQEITEMDSLRKKYLFPNLYTSEWSEILWTTWGLPEEAAREIWGHLELWNMCWN